jgi:DNA-binding transcriptional LysR family regulator
MSRYNIALESYRVFCMVVKCGQVSKAAEELFVTQPSVSMSIKLLEEKLGCSLFVRLPKGIKLTSEGKLLYSYLEPAMGLIDVAERKYSEMTHLESGEINICASDSIISGLLLPYLEKYNGLYSKISIKVINRTSGETVDLLKSGSIDLGFINLPYGEDEHIERLKRIGIHDCLVYGTKYEELSRLDFNIKEIVNYPLLMLKQASHVRELLDDYAQQYGIMINPIMEFDSTDLLLKFVKANLGVALVIEEFVKAEIDNRTLFAKRLIPAIHDRAVGMVKLKSIPLSHAATKFAELLLQETEEVGTK